MYRRLKNLLGVSLIILAIVLSQLPMGAVQADDVATSGTEQADNVASSETEQVTDIDVSNGTNTDSDVTDDTDTDNGTSGEETDSNGIAVLTDEVGGETGSIEGTTTVGETGSTDGTTTVGETGSADGTTTVGETGSTDGTTTVGETGSADGTTSDEGTDSSDNTTEAAKYTVKFDYGFTCLNPAVSECTVTEQDTVDNVVSSLPITDDKYTDKNLQEGEVYTIKTIDYQFLGWYQDIDCTTKWELGKRQVTSDITLYASWYYVANDSKVFEINFVADGSNKESQTVTLVPGKRLKRPEVEPYRAGYEFIDWYEKVSSEKIDEKVIPTGDVVYLAKWTATQYTVTFNANGGKFDDTSTVTTEVVFNGKPISKYPTILTDSYTGYTVDEENWYTDKECLNLYVKSTDGVETPVTSSMTLYKKWTHTTDKGFTMNPEGTVLYSFTGSQKNVVIPSTVKIIATDAFANMQSVESVTLPAGIADIKENAFSGANNISWTVKIYSSSDGSNDSMIEGKELANRYKNFTYVSSGSTGGSSSSDTVKLEGVTCNLNKVNLGIDDNGSYIYPQVTLPTDLAKGAYQVIFTELNTPTTIKTLLEQAGYNMDSSYIYYMDISMKKLGEIEGYIPTWQGKMTIKMALPVSWYGRDMSQIKIVTVSEDGLRLDVSDITNLGSNLFSFNPKHFSEYALVYIPSASVTPPNENVTPDTPSTPTPDTPPTPTPDTGSTGKGGGSSSGGSSSSSGSNSSGGSTSSASLSTTTTPAVTTPIQQLPATTQPAVTPATSTGGSTGGTQTTAHVKDSTPKTGDPLEYRSILVCSFFSIGILLLLIGNKKKTSSSFQGLRA